MRLIVAAARKKILARMLEIEADPRANDATVRLELNAERAALKWVLVLLAGG